MTNEAAEKNFLTLSRHNFDLEKAIHAQQHSPLGYGSEFRSTQHLKRIFGSHPCWFRMESILSNGAKFPLEELDAATRASDLQEALAFGNHKGASSNPTLLKRLVEKDVTHGYALPLPLAKISRLPGALMAPMNIMRQNTIDEQGRIVEKDRLTHDQSYKWSSGTSVNSRVDKSKLLPCMFGATIRRVANLAVALRRKYPNLPIVASKIDFKSAYRRLHLDAATAIQTCTQLPEQELALIALRLTFGGSPCPNIWGCLAEPICDLANAIMEHDDWDPLSLHAPNHELVPPKKLMDDNIPFAEGKPLIVDVPVDPKGKSDLYIDDLISLAVDIPGSDNVKRLERGNLLAIHATARPKHPSEPIPREEMAAENKLAAEARAEELKIILGWLFNFRGLMISLPDNKFVAWSEAILKMINEKETTALVLGQNIGRLVHLGFVLPQVYHFMSRIRELHDRSLNRRSISINETCIKDLELMLAFLNKARDGVDMNQLVYRKPTHVYRSDSCPAGLGGYSHEGWAWRFYIPYELQGRASNNLLEHIASIITVWIDLLAGRLKPGDCSLSMTDSTTSEGWARKTNFKEDGEEPIQATIRIEVARSHALRLLENNIKDYSQWFQGKANDVADALSRDDDRSDEELTHILRTYVPSQVPKHFSIVPLPNEISSWLISLLQRLPEKEQLRERHTRTKLGRGEDGVSTSSPSVQMTTTSTTSQDPNESNSWEPLPWLCVEEDFQDQLMTPWLKAQSEVPFHMWHRPSGKTIGQTQPKTMMASLADFYHAYSEPSEMKTLTQSNKKLSQSA
jgi:hypothetical protein